MPLSTGWQLLLYNSITNPVDTHVLFATCCLLFQGICGFVPTGSKALLIRRHKIDAGSSGDTGTMLGWQAAASGAFRDKVWGRVCAQ